MGLVISTIQMPAARLRLLQSWTYAGDIPELIFRDLGGLSEVELVMLNMTLSSALLSKQIQVSIDNGVTFLSTSGDYVQVSTTGAVTNFANVPVQATSAATARSGILRITAFNQVGPKPTEVIHMFPGGQGVYLTLGAGLLPLNALKILLGGGAGNITGGSAFLYGV